MPRSAPHAAPDPCGSAARAQSNNQRRKAPRGAAAECKKRRAARAAGPDIQIRIDDDGLGFADGAGTPWSISSRVDQLGGQVQLARDNRAGAHLAIALRAG